jgi:hypothetical protein
MSCRFSLKFDCQVAELQVRAVIVNRFTWLDTPMTVSMP